MGVDEPRCDDTARHVHVLGDGRRAVRERASNGHDPAIDDGDVAVDGRAAGAVVDHGVAQDEVDHRPSPFTRPVAATRPAEARDNGPHEEGDAVDAPNSKDESRS